jgi:hypothetical protein
MNIRADCIRRETALRWIEQGFIRYAGMHVTDNGWRYWVLKKVDFNERRFVHLTPGEPLVGCVACGKIVDPIPDDVGIGCHCPCGATL